MVLEVSLVEMVELSGSVRGYACSVLVVVAFIRMSTDLGLDQGYP